MQSQSAMEELRTALQAMSETGKLSPAEAKTMDRLLGVMSSVFSPAFQPQLEKMAALYGQAQLEANPEFSQAERAFFETEALLGKFRAGPLSVSAAITPGAKVAIVCVFLMVVELLVWGESNPQEFKEFAAFVENSPNVSKPALTLAEIERKATSTIAAEELVIEQLKCKPWFSRFMRLIKWFEILPAVLKSNQHKQIVDGITQDFLQKYADHALPFPHGVTGWQQLARVVELPFDTVKKKKFSLSDAHSHAEAFVQRKSVEVKLLKDQLNLASRTNRRRSKNTEGKQGNQRDCPALRDAAKRMLEEHSGQESRSPLKPRELGITKQNLLRVKQAMAVWAKQKLKLDIESPQAAYEELCQNHPESLLQCLTDIVTGRQPSNSERRRSGMSFDKADRLGLGRRPK